MSVQLKLGEAQLNDWPRLMRQRDSGRIFIVSRYEGMGGKRVYRCYIVDTGEIVNRSDTGDLEPLPAGTTLTITNS
jgi:hypothetical protein